MANANILLNGMVPTPTLQDTFRGSMQAAEAFNNMQNQPLRNKLLQAQVASAETQNKATAMGLDAETAKFQIGDAAKDAMMIKPMLAQDPARAVAALDARIQKITERGGDPSDTKYLRDGLASGQITPQQAIGELDNVIGTAERFGLLSGSNGEMFAPMPAFDAQGNPVFVQGSRSGGLRPIGGFRPYTPTTDEKTAAAIRQAEATTNLKIGAAPLIAAGSEQAKLDVQGRMLPQIEANKTRATEGAKEEAVRATTITKAIADEKEVGRILDLADPLLEKTTESLAGATLDAAGRLVGVSTEGSRAAAQLKTLEGALVMKMPRMEGPQSDADRLLYRQMAAQIGDPTTPVEDRRAAMSVLRDLNSRYSGKQPASAQHQGGPVQIQSDDDYNSLPSGAEFIAPDGSRRRKP